MNPTGPVPGPAANSGHRCDALCHHDPGNETSGPPELGHCARCGTVCVRYGREGRPVCDGACAPVRRHDHSAQREDAPPLGAAALACAARGWYVFPLRPGDKRPAFPDHDAGHCTGRDPRCRDGHQGWEPRASTDPGRIRRAWTRAPYGIGIATGPSGLVVIDLDIPKPGQDTPPPEWRIPGVRTGTDALAVLCERAGQPYPSSTYTVTTGRGGTHLYFTAPAGSGLRNTQGARGGLGWLIDTRAGGGYVVAAGSTIHGRSYTVACDGSPAPLPRWLAGRLRPAALPPQKPVDVTLLAGRLGPYLRAAVTGEIERVTSSPAHGHNTALYRAAVALGQLAAGGALSADDVTAWLAAAAEGVGQSPGEARRTIASGLRAGAKRPRSVAA